MGAISDSSGEDLRSLPLADWHAEHGARMVPFAGHAMPLQYEGIVAEHEWTRTHASLFDVSHMGQLRLTGPEMDVWLETLVPGDIAGLKPGRMRYSMLLDETGGILDDLMVTRLGDHLFLVVNGAMRVADLAYLRAQLPANLSLGELSGHALLALQGPEAAAVLDVLVPAAANLGFLQAAVFDWQGHDLMISRSGYTGEDGFEISLPAEAARPLAQAIVADERARPAGLGARDSLRLEAGLPLYGHDLTPDTDPVSAGLAFAISKRRRDAGGFPGAARIASLLAEGPPLMRVGLALEGRLPGREGAQVYHQDHPVGRITSGGFSPTLQHPVALAMIASEHASEGSVLAVEVRGKMLPARVVPLPFVPHRYYRRGV